MDFGQTLLALIQEKEKSDKSEKRFSQAEFARQLGVQRQRIYEWTSGRTEPNMETLMKIAEILGVAIGVLFGEKPPPPPIDQTLLTEIMILVEKLVSQNQISLPEIKKAQFISSAYKKILEKRAGDGSDISAAADIIELFSAINSDEPRHESGRRKGGRTTFP